MLEFLDSINHWHWLAFGLALLAMELLGTAGYFLWLGISALIVGVIFTSLPMSWQLQWVSFGVFSLITTWLWWRRQLKADTKDDQSRDLNQKQKQLVGQTLVLEEDIVAGKNRIELNGTSWMARSESNIMKGSRITIVDVEGITLKIKATE
ncbi:NfeD family protein [Vibrio kyushuensis]|uniref:NfeD family protein n=1 Tax=Vibrio kyushuensis TaxID=2910249 RepID=UPI003D0F8D2E